jgi:hypothetical protein
MPKDSLKIRSKRTSMRLCFVVGILFKLVYDYFHMELYHFYLYFYLVGLIAFLFATIPWGEITQIGIEIRYGFFNLNSLNLNWHRIEMIILSKMKEKRSSNMPVTIDVEINALAFNLIEPLSEKVYKDLEACEGKSFLTNAIRPAKNASAILISTEPDGGFENILRVASGFVKVEPTLTALVSGSYIKKIALILDCFLLFFVCYSFFWTFG